MAAPPCYDDRMPRKPKPKPDDPAQSKRFIEAAREIEADENDASVDRVLKRMAKDRDSAAKSDAKP